MNKLIATLIATTFIMGSAFAQTATAPAKPVVATTTVAPATASNASIATPAVVASASSVKSASKPSSSAIAETPGGGVGKVWVNTKSNTYHCQGTEFYGKTKVGEYMTETDAKTKGAHANHGTACK